jgi:hypothetical protein
VVGVTSTDTGEPKTIYAPLLAAAGDDAYGVALWRFDADGRIRRFDERLGVLGEVVPTLVGRLASRLAGAGRAQPAPGIIQYAFGDGFDYIPLQQLLDWADRGDGAALERAFAGKIVFIGSVLPFEDRFHQPVPLARWEAREYAPGCTWRCSTRPVASARRRRSGGYSASNGPWDGPSRADRGTRSLRH